MKSWLVALIGVIAVLAIVATAAISMTSDEPLYARHQPMHPQTGPASPEPAWSWHGMHRRSLDEHEYLAEMVAHHREAVSAAHQLKRSYRPEMRALGASIVTSQSAQIHHMSRWLRQWYPNRSHDVGYRPMMRDLTTLTGDALDRAFLQDMIGHHMAAVMTSQHLLTRGIAQHQAVARLAATVRNDQRTEIIQMRRWLTVWFNEGWRHWPGHDNPRGWEMGPGTMMPIR
ncbi:MAG: DUF305 domain-containing protein [Actinomycetes bacterium]